MKRVKNIHCPFKSNCVNRPIGVTAMVLHDLEDAWPLGSSGLSARVFAPQLCHAERGADLVLHWLGEGQQIFLTGTHPKQRPFARNALQSAHSIIPVLGYTVKRSNVEKLSRTGDSIRS